MTRQLLKLGLSGWRSRWLGTGLTFVLVLVAAAVLLFSANLNDVASQPWHRTFDATNGAHLTAFGPSRDIDQLAGVDGVVEASGPTPMVVTSATVGGQTYGLRTLGLAEDPPTVDRPFVTAGRWLAGEGELVLEQSFARVVGIDVGDNVELKRSAGELPVRVVGLAVLAREAPYPDNQPAEGYVVAGDLSRIQPNEQRWSWLETVRLDDPAAVAATARRALDQLPSSARVLTFDSRLEDGTERHRTTTIVLRTFGITLLIAVGLVLATLVSGHVADRSTELGLLKAVGFGPAQISVVVAVEQLAVALPAAVAGALVGSWTTPALVRRSTELLGTVPVEVSPTRIAVTAAIALAAVALAAAAPTLRLARAGVLVSLGADRSRRGTSRLAHRVPLRAPLPVALGVKETLARRARSAATGAALALSVGSLVAGLAFEATVRHEDAVEAQALTDRPRDAVLDELAPSGPDPVPITDSTREQLRPIVRGLNIVLASVAVINLLAAALLSLRRRRRDIAVTRAIGFTPEQVRRSIAWGDGLVGVIAAIAGIPLGTAMFLAVYRLVNGSTDLAALPPLWQLAAVPLATVAAVLAVVAIPARQASRASIIDGLAYE